MYNDYMNFKIGKRLRELRKENGWTQSQLAEMAGISRVNYTRYETDVCRPDFETLLKLAEIFDVSLDYIFSRYEYGK